MILRYILGIILILGLFLIIFNQQDEIINYQKKQYFFSYSEYQFFLILQKSLQKNYNWKYIIFPKVRVADIFETNNQKWINKIRAKHIDFLIVDTEKHFDPVLAIELNWSSHFTEKQKKSDKFKQELFDRTWFYFIIFYNQQIQNINFIEEKIIKTLWNINKFWQWSIIKEQN